MISMAQYNADRTVLPQIPVASIHPIDKSAICIDITLLASALFLQRFCFGNPTISFDMVAAVLIVAYQFASGRLLIQYDRLLWFLVLVLAATSSLLLNFRSTMLTSYGLFLVMYFLFILSHPSTPDRYKSTLRGFQFLILILSGCAIAQFAAQFVIDGGQIIRFFGIVPDFFAVQASEDGGGWNTIIPITPGSSLVKSNGIFLVEPSTMSQMAALGILIEVLEFRRPRYLIPLALGLLLSYSGSGITILLLFLPLTGLVNRRSQLVLLLFTLLVIALLASGIINLSVFTSRVSEFDDTNASAFQRFISSFWMAGEHFDTASLPVLLRGAGPGTMKEFAPLAFYTAFGGTWFKVVYEYGLIGAFVFTCFLASCFRRSRCPKLLIAAIIYFYLFTSGNLLNTSYLIIIVVLCTLSGPETRQIRADSASGYRQFVASSS